MPRTQRQRDLANQTRSTEVGLRDYLILGSWRFREATETQRRRCGVVHRSRSPERHVYDNNIKGRNNRSSHTRQQTLLRLAISLRPLQRVSFNMTAFDKDMEIAAANTDNHPSDAPPSYTPRETYESPDIPPPTQPSKSPINPPSPSATPGPSESRTPENIYAPQPPFSNDLAGIGPEPANVICPRCHYGVRTNTKPRAGMHVG